MSALTVLQQATAASSTTASQTAASAQAQDDNGLFAAEMDKQQQAPDAIGVKMRRLMGMRGATAEQSAAVNAIFLQVQEDQVSPASAKDFLRGLTDNQMEALRVAHSLADPINVDSLSEEGAINLLLPDDKALDVDNNGLVNVGRATTFRMPPPNAPDSVKAAWEETTKGMSEKDRMLAEGKFMIELMTANAKTDAQGNFVGFYEPDDPEWTNPYAKEGFSWKAQAQQMLDSLEFMKNKISTEQYQRDLSFLTKWMNALGAQGVS